MTKQKTLIMGGAAVGIIGLLWAASAARGKDDGIVGGGGGGGYSVPFVDADKGSEKTEGGGMPSYSIAFPDVSIPTMPQPNWGFSDSSETYTPAHSTPTYSIPTEVTHSSGKKETINITAPPGGITPTTGRPAGPLSQEEKDFMAGGGGFGGGGAGGRGDTSKKDSGTNPISDFIGGIGNAIGGFFGW